MSPNFEPLKMLKNSVIEITLAKKNVLKRERESERKEIKYQLLNHKKKETTPR